MADLPHLPAEIWNYISTDNFVTYYVMIQVSKLFVKNIDDMKAKFIKQTIVHGNIFNKLPNGWSHSCNDQPAIIYEHGSKYWYIDNKLHRDNDKPAIIYANGDQHWYINGKQHRDGDKPAEIYTAGGQSWYINGKLHRDNDQPAVIWVDGRHFYYINDIQYH